MPVRRWFSVKNTRVRGLHTSRRTTCYQRWSELAWPSMGAAAWLRWVLLTLVRQAENPHKVALGFAIGVWVSFTPVLGTHLLLAGFACWVLRASFFSAFVGSWVGNPWTYYFMWYSGYEFGRVLFNMPRVNIESMLAGGLNLQVIEYNAEVLLHQVLLPALVGGWIVGVPFSAIFYFLVRWQVRKAVKKRHKRMHMKKLAWADGYN